MQPVAFEFYEQVMFLDPQVVVVPLADALSGRGAVIKRAAARAARLADEWLQRNLYEVDQTMAHWLDTLARRCEEAMRERLDAVRREVIDAVAAGRRRREQGEAAVKQQMGGLDRQRSLVAQALARPTGP